MHLWIYGDEPEAGAVCTPSPNENLGYTLALQSAAGAECTTAILLVSPKPCVTKTSLAQVLYLKNVQISVKSVTLLFTARFITYCLKFVCKYTAIIVDWLVFQYWEELSFYPLTGRPSEFFVNVTNIIIVQCVKLTSLSRWKPHNDTVY